MEAERKTAVKVSGDRDQTVLYCTPKREKKKKKVTWHRLLLKKK